ncbi:MAG: ribonuclease R [Myxococcaceae bacterium]
MSLEPEQLKAVLREEARPLGVKELLRLAGLHPGQQTALKRVLRDLVREGAIQKEGKRFFVPERGGARARAAIAGKLSGQGGGRRVEGTLHIHRDGFGFVHPLSGEGENIYVPPEQAQRALDNDKVVVELVPGTGGRKAGRIVKVIGRLRTRAVGTYVVRGDNSFVIPNDSSLPGVIQVPSTQLARPGDLVKVRLGVGAALLEARDGLIGEVTGSLGKPGDPSGEVLSVAYSQGFSEEFPDAVMDLADRIRPRVSEEEASGEGRRDLRDLPLVTIDGEDARDFDDAVYAEDRAGGWRLVVAIADVSHYVREGTALDEEALHRATSVYLPNRVLPMLPERLSNGICSLKPDEDRLCMVADMVFSRSAELKSYEIYPALMRSVARCTYNEVQDVLDGTDVPHRNAFKPHFERLMALSLSLNEMRGRRGAIDFDLPETKIVLDEEGGPVRMEKRERKDSHRLVEECMLAANEAVAKFFQDSELPSVYRFHGEPDEEKLAAFATVARAHGFELPMEDLSSAELNEFLKQLQDHPERRALNQLLLRSMMQAVYSSENIGHFGLAAEHYLHFTSPIRRYPDLLVHRLLKAQWDRGERARTKPELEAETEKLEGLAVQSSERERAAMQVEREVVSFYSVLLMKDRVGEEFEATVASVTDFGFFVELDHELVEGLVKAETVSPDFDFDSTLNALVYTSLGIRVRVGQKLRVTLISANLQRRQLDFTPISFEGTETRPQPRFTVKAGRPVEDRGGGKMRWAERKKQLEEKLGDKHRGEGESRRAEPRRQEPRRQEPPRRTEAPVAAPPKRGASAHDRRHLLEEKPWEKPRVFTRPGDEDDRPRDDDEGVASPHPGFDRLRALAAKSSGGGQRPERRGPTSRLTASGKKQKERGGSPRAGGGRTSSKRGGPKGRR